MKVRFRNISENLETTVILDVDKAIIEKVLSINVTTSVTTYRKIAPYSLL